MSCGFVPQARKRQLDQSNCSQFPFNCSIYTTVWGSRCIGNCTCCFKYSWTLLNYSSLQTVCAANFTGKHKLSWMTVYVNVYVYMWNVGVYMSGRGQLKSVKAWRRQSQDNGKVEQAGKRGKTVSWEERELQLNDNAWEEESSASHFILIMSTYKKCNSSHTNIFHYICPNLIDFFCSSQAKSFKLQMNFEL